MKKAVPAILVVVLIAGCATFNRDMYVTLNAAATTYEQTMSAFSDLDKLGKLDAATKSKVIEVARVYWVAYHGAVDAYYVYAADPTKPNEERVVVLVGQLTAAVAKLLAELQPLISKGVK